MKGEKLNLLLGLLLLPSLLMAQKSPLEPWQDPEVNEVNRMAAHTDFVNKNEWRMSLHGVWGEMPIPGMWEMNGLGEPMYCGIGYEWKTWWKSNPPALPDSANYSYTYVRNWTVPKAISMTDRVPCAAPISPSRSMVPWCRLQRKNLIN